VIELGAGIRLRLIEAGDGPALAAAYRRNREHLARWDPARRPEFYTDAHQSELVAATLAEQDAGRCRRFVFVDDGGDRILGRLNVNNIIRGAFHSADLGYWLDAGLTGRGLMSSAIRAVADHCRVELELHRLQAATLVHNAASQRTLRSAGFQRIGMAPRYLLIAGEWQDHILFQRILEDGQGA
jgi:ribosomal-protein-alanine N-acetyltransferase